MAFVGHLLTQILHFLHCSAISGSRHGASGQGISDANTLILMEETGPNLDIGAVSMEGEREHKVLLQESYNEAQPQISPDGEWMAYQSDESDQYEIYIRPFPDVSKGKKQVSDKGGTEPKWSPDGRAGRRRRVGSTRSRTRPADFDVVREHLGQ